MIIFCFITGYLHFRIPLVIYQMCSLFEFSILTFVTVPLQFLFLLLSKRVPADQDRTSKVKMLNTNFINTKDIGKHVFTLTFLKISSFSSSSATLSSTSLEVLSSVLSFQKQRGSKCTHFLQGSQMVEPSVLRRHLDNAWELEDQHVHTRGVLELQCLLMFRFTDCLIFLRFNWNASYKILTSEWSLKSKELQLFCLS